MTSSVRFYALADFGLQEVVEFYGSRPEAEQALRAALADEPHWQATLGLVALEFGAPEPLVEVLRAPALSSRRSARESRNRET